MKKKQKSAGTSAATTTTTTTTTDLKAIIHEHRLFFDKLIDLIPPRFYLPNDADNKPWYQGLSKAAKASLKRQTKENLKLARRNRLDPDLKDQSSTLDLLKQSLDKQKQPSESEEQEVVTAPIKFEDDDDDDDDNATNNNSVTYEELRERLRRKIETLRGNRGESSHRMIENAKDSKKRKRNDDVEHEIKRKSNDAVENEIEFGKIKIGDDDGEAKKKKKKKVNKAKELERLKRLEEVKRENRTVADREAWKAAENRAVGIKVHDDPSKLKTSMKKEKKRKEKSSEKWKDRVESQRKSQDERQQKRRDNIAGKIKEKKNRKIAKREKKLMRPGFEGRKDGYITQDKS